MRAFGSHFLVGSCVRCEKTDRRPASTPVSGVTTTVQSGSPQSKPEDNTGGSRIPVTQLVLRDPFSRSLVSKMRPPFPLVLCSVLVVSIASLASADPVDFAHDIVPLLRKHCGKCHTGAKAQGGFSFNTRNSLLKGGESGKAVVVNRSGDSLLIERITTDDPDLRMPPDGERIPADDITRLRQWIDAGLPWDDGFAFQKSNYEPPLKPYHPEIPPAHAGRDNPVDRFLDAWQSQRNLPLGQRVDDRTFARRVSLDLVGLLPEPEQLSRFLAERRPDRRDRLIAELLANDVAYADHWLTFWNDLLRNDYTGTGFITGGRKQITTWLYRALIENRRYDQMVRELIAPGSEAEGFIQGIRWRGEVSASQTNEVQFAQSISQAFLGINMKCASCHDSFIDRWKLDEAFGLAAIYATEPLAIHRCDKPTGATAKAAWLFPELGQIDASAPQPERLKQLAALMTHPENGRFSRTIVNRLWHRMMGRGIVHPVDAMNTEPWYPDLLEFLAADFADHGYDLKHTLGLIARSQAYQSQMPAQVMTESPEAPAYIGPLPRRLTAEQFVDAVWQITGAAPAQPDAVVVRGKLPDAESAGTSEVRPLTAQWIWSEASASRSAPAGQTISVRKTFDLPAATERATAAITCDNQYAVFINGRKVAADGNWETVEVVAIDPFLRPGKNVIDIVASNGGADANPAGLLFEARIRLTGRDDLVVATGADWSWSASKPDANGRFESEPTDWKPAVPVESPGVWGARLGDEPANGLALGMAAGRQMVRASLVKSDFLMRTLGRPNRDQIVSMRPNDLTTLEALDLANGDTLALALEAGATRALARFSGKPRELVDWLFVLALSRPPTPAERDAAVEFLGPNPGEQLIQDLIWSVLMQPEFQLVR